MLIALMISQHATFAPADLSCDSLLGMRLPLLLACAAPAGPPLHPLEKLTRLLMQCGCSFLRLRTLAAP